MSNFIKAEDNPLKNTIIKKARSSHIEIVDRDICLNKCEDKPCTFYCPSRVFSWEGEKIVVDYGRCVECGACPWGCPYENISWNFPPGGFGVKYFYKLND